MKLRHRRSMPFREVPDLDLDMWPSKTDLRIHEVQAVLDGRVDGFNLDYDRILEASKGLKVTTAQTPDQPGLIGIDTDYLDGLYAELDGATFTGDVRCDGALRPYAEFQHKGSTLGFFNKAATAQKDQIPDPSGGSTIDVEARSAIGKIIDALEAYGLTAS